MLARAGVYRYTSKVFRLLTIAKKGISMFRKVALALLMGLFVAGCVAIPSQDEPVAYTQSVVQDAIRRYERDGREATIAYHSSAASVSGQWYVFIIGEDARTIAHYLHERIGLDPSVRVDSTGYFYGDDILSATEEGKWVSYVYRNPETGEEGSKHSWVVRHDGLIFGSGWYEKE